MGVCLGHQSIIQAFGGHIVKAGKIMHGKTSPVSHNNESIFRDLPNPFEAGRYHSLVGDRTTIPDCLEVIAESDDNEIMGLRHREHEIIGIQFHPESVLTPNGDQLMKNFLELV